MVVPDGEPVGAALRALLTQHPAVVITSGGTGLSPDDRTPEVTLPLLDREIPGIMEAIRRAGAAKTPLAVLSRGHAGAAGQHVHRQPARFPEGRHGRPGRPGSRARAPLRPVGGPDMGTETAFEVVHAVLERGTISVDQAIAAVESDTAGAVVSFSGVVRNHDGGKAVERLSYSAHPTAHQVMADVVARLVAEHAAENRGKRNGAETGSAANPSGSGPRTGSACWKSATLPWYAPSPPPHRGQAFAVCAELVDRIKDQVPIWKEQFFTDGTVEWVGAGS